MASPLAFLDQLSQAEQREYVILLDCGPMMRGPAWMETRKVLQSLVPAVCQANAKGLFVTVFAESYISTGCITDEIVADTTLHDMAEAFSSSKSSCLGPPLKSAIDDHFARGSSSTSILVVTTGDVADGLRATILVGNIINRLRTLAELTISFLQPCRTLHGARFLLELPTAVRTECRFPIVDALLLDMLPIGQRLEDYVKEILKSQQASPLSLALSRCLSSTPSSNGTPLSSRQGSLIMDQSPHLDFNGSGAGINLAFYKSISTRAKKRYEVVLDCSDGMSLANYNVARHILSHTLASVYELNSDGLTMWVLQGATVKGIGNITNGKQLDDLFWNFVPKGVTRLTGMQRTLNEHLKNQQKMLSILVVVASLPLDLQETIEMLRRAAAQDTSRSISVSFLNVGKGKDFTEQLAREVNLKARRSFVDAYHLTGESSEGSISATSSPELQDKVQKLVHEIFPDKVEDPEPQFNIRSNRSFYLHYGK